MFGIEFLSRLRARKNADLQRSAPPFPRSRVAESLSTTRSTAPKSRPLFEALEGRLLMSAAPGLEPVVLVPGFAASMPPDSTVVAEWLPHRGISPDKLQVDPVGDTYNDLLQTLKNAGYRDHADLSDPNNPLPQTLYVATWDWRVPV